MIFVLLGVPGKLKALLDRLTAARAGYLDAAITSRADATHYNSTRAAKLDYLDAAISSMAGIPTVQTGYISSGFTLGSGEDARYYDVTVSAVSAVDACAVTVRGWSGVGVELALAGTLTSTTNLRVTTIGYNVGTATVSARWTVIDYGG
jgi:hypothetical protein